MCVGSGWRAVALAVGVLWAGAHGASAAQQAERARPVREVARREVPDDPPGVPAPQERRRGGPTAGLRDAFRNFGIVQANVGALGRNVTGDAANEPSIVVDPVNPRRMAIGWRQFDTIQSNFRQAGWAYSHDGGRTWTSPGVIEPGVFRSDPVLDADSQGNFYYNSLSVTGGSIYTCQVFRSTDGGATWGTAVEAFGGDKAWMTIDRTGGLGDGNVYQSWNVFGGCCGNDTFNRSIDGSAAVFSAPQSVPLMPLFGTLAVASDGTLYVSGADPFDFSNFLVARSTDANDPNPDVTPTFVTSMTGLGGTLTVGAAPNPDGLLGQVNVGVDPASGDVYLLASVDPPGPDPLDVHFARSVDGGVTWSAPVRINDDPIGGNAWQWFGTMSVAPNGRIDVVWNDTRRSGVAHRSELYYAFSTDGGTTWSTNRRLSPMWNSHVGWPNQFKIGDYYDMVSDDAGAHLAFAATFNGEQDVYYLRILP